MKRRVSQSGFTLVETLVSIGIGTFLLGSIGALVAWTMQNQSHAMAVGQIEMMKQIILKNLDNDAAWMNTITKNSAAAKMDCLVKLTPCTTTGAPGGPPMTDVNFALYDSGGKIYHDATDPAAGFDQRGNSCNGWSAAGNDQCPFRFDLKWSAVCAVGSCVAPQVMVSGTLLYRPSAGNPSRMILNPLNHSIHNHYVSPSACFAKTQIYNSPAGNPYSFTVPANYNYMTVEAWGGGGGGAGVSSIWTGCFPPAPGGAGTASSFVGGAANLVATGGPPGTEMLQLGQHIWIWCIWAGFPVCGVVTFPDCDGTVPANPPLNDRWRGGDGGVVTGPPGGGFPPNLQQCSALVSGGPGRGGDQQTATSGFAGSAGGGGGAGSPVMNSAALFVGANWLVSTWAMTMGGQGAYDVAQLPSYRDAPYAAASYTPATLAPGTTVNVVVGQGGLGGNSNGRTGGHGANGLVRIVYW